MKKILHLTHTDISSDSRIIKEMKALNDEGYQVSGLGITLEEEEHKSLLNFSGEVKSISLASRRMDFLPRTIRHTLSLFELIAKMLPLAVKQKPEVIHCHDTLVLPLGVLVKLFTKAKLVYDAHELESDRNGLTGLQSKLTRFVEKTLWRFVDRLIVVSPSIDSWYQDNIGVKPSEVILNSPLLVGSESFSDNYLRQKFSIPEDEKIFLYVGILGIGRGIDLLVEAFSHKDVSAHLVFLGYGELAGYLQQRAEEFNNFHVHSAVPHADVVPIAKSADYGLCLIQNVSLSDYYCLPNKLFEYCFAGVPVLASNFPDIRAVVDAYNLGGYCELNADSVRSKVMELQGTTRLYHFNDVYPLSWQAQEEKIKKLYKTLFSIGLS